MGVCKKDFYIIANDVDYISFDIFDTLIKRNVQKPADIFKLVEIEYYKKYKNRIDKFSEKRIKAEKISRKNIKGEVTLDDIYNSMTCYDTTKKNRIKELEKSTEIINSTFNNDLNNIYKWACQNKKIIITSDIYLDEKIIKEILSKNSIKYDKLFISSKYKLRKKDGKLFDYIINNLNIEPEKILHIGDNENSDYIQPKLKGMKAFHYIEEKQYNYFNQKQIKRNIDYNVLCNFINNKINRKNFFYNFGYECFGPFLYSFTSWLFKELKKEEIRKVYFLARDGKIIKKAFDILNDSSNTYKSYYFYASRRAIIVPSLWRYNNIDDILNSINIPQRITINDLKNRVGLDDEDISYLLEKYNLSLTTKYQFSILKSNYHEFLDDLYEIITNNSKREYTEFNNYRKSMDFYGKLAIVDIGWLGNMQVALNNMCNKDTNIFGYYLGLRNNKKKNIKSKGYMFDYNKNHKQEEQEMLFNPIFEFIFTANHGSVKRYVNNEIGAELYQNENKNKYEKDALVSIQNGAIDFIHDFHNSEIKNLISIDEYNAFYNIYKMLFEPTAEDANYFGQLKFKDGEIYTIAQKDSSFKLSSFKNCLWKIGYMRRNIRWNLPFGKIYKIYKFIKK